VPAVIRDQGKATKARGRVGLEWQLKTDYRVVAVSLFIGYGDCTVASRN